jgi:hypothetical protein
MAILTTAKSKKGFYSKKVACLDNSIKKHVDLIEKKEIELTCIEEKYAEKKKELEAEEKKVSDERKKENTDSMPVDIKLQAKKLHNHLIIAKKKKSEYLFVKQEVSLKKIGIDLVKQRLERIKKKLKEAENELVAAKKREIEHQNWKKKGENKDFSELIKKAALVFKAMEDSEKKCPISLDESIFDEKTINIVKESISRISGDRSGQSYKGGICQKNCSI